METRTLEREAGAGYRDLREWLEVVDSLGQLRVVRGADWNLELGTITELNTRRRESPALLFDDIAGYPSGFRVASTLLCNATRLSLTLGLPTEYGTRQLVQALRGKPRTWEQLAGEFPPETVESGPIFENVFVGDEVDVLRFPAPKWHQQDGGRYFGTGCCVITRDPETGLVNVGTYRVMIHDSKTVGLMISPGKQGNIHLQKYQALGEPCPVAVVFGEDPALFVAAGSEVPSGVSEYNYTGAMKGAAVRVVTGPVTGLPIPADGEIAIEGFVMPGETRPEGPFGEWTGYYASGERGIPFIRVQAVYHRNDPIILGCPPNRPPHDYTYWRSVVRSAMLQDAVEKAGVPDVRGVWAHEAGGSRLLLVVSIKQRYAGHARQAGFVASQCREGAYAGRYVVVVDEDIDPTNTDDVLWAICTRSDPAGDIDFIRRAWSTALDPMVRPGSEGMFNSRAIIDACRPWEWLSEFPAVSESSPELMAKVRAKWQGVLDL